MTDSSLLDIRNLYKSYQKGGKTIAVLHDASFRIAQGDMVSVIGASGAGKSTLLHLLGTLDTPEKGDIFYQGTNLTQLNATQLAEFRNHQLGFVFQFHHLLPEFSAIENVMMPCLIRRLPRREALQMAQRALEDVGMMHRAEHKPGELSGGEQQRVALARALVLEPPLLLADEVTGNLDEKTGEEIHELLFSLNQKRQITMVVVTHNQGLAKRMPRQLILQQGQVQECAQ